MMSAKIDRLFYALSLAAFVATTVFMAHTLIFYVWPATIWSAGG